MSVDQLPAALEAAGSRLRAMPSRLGPSAAQAILDAANPPRDKGALDASGRVIANAAVFGGGTVTYAAPVHKANPFLDRAVDAALENVLDLAAAELADAITLL